MVKMAAKFLDDRIGDQALVRSCYETGERIHDVEPERFRADAKAEGDVVGIGGWECRNRHGPVPAVEARWFAIHLDRTIAPWVFRRGEPFRQIASLELLGTFLCYLALDSVSTRKWLSCHPN